MNTPLTQDRVEKESITETLHKELYQHKNNIVRGESIGCFVKTISCFFCDSNNEIS